VITPQAYRPVPSATLPPPRDQPLGRWQRDRRAARPRPEGGTGRAGAPAQAGYLTIWMRRSMPSWVCSRWSWVSMRHASTQYPFRADAIASIKLAGHIPMRHRWSLQIQPSVHIPAVPDHRDSNDMRDLIHNINHSVVARTDS
jgi:hypothetical protein